MTGYWIGSGDGVGISDELLERASHLDVQLVRLQHLDASLQQLSACPADIAQPRARKKPVGFTQTELASSRTRNAVSLSALPLFASDDVLGAALLGPDRVQEFTQMVPMLEARGLPKIDHLMGGRYTACRRRITSITSTVSIMRTASVPLAPDGVEDFDGWKKQERPA